VIVGSALEAPAVVSGLDDIAVVGQSIEQRGGHFGVTEDARPLAAAKPLMSGIVSRSQTMTLLMSHI
jgi:hypothetical protein